MRICDNGTWYKICGYGDSVIDDNLASIICSDLGYSPYGILCTICHITYNILHVLILQCVGAKSSIGIWYDYKYPYQFFNVKCYGNESSFFGCRYDTTGSCYYNHWYYAVAVFCHESKCTHSNCVIKYQLVHKVVQ